MVGICRRKVNWILDTDIRATPIPIAGPKLIAMVDEELGGPTNPQGRAYGDEDQLAFALVSALKRHEACR